MQTPRAPFTVDPVGPLQVVTVSPCAIPVMRILARCPPVAIHAAVTLHNRSDTTLTRLRVHYQPGDENGGQVLASNFSVRSLAFFSKGEAVDLAADEGAGRQLPPHGQLTLDLSVGRLMPGEYRGWLHFTSGQAGDEEHEAMLPLVIRVRHHWWVPLAVVFLGSAFGWLGSKYVVAVRRRQLLVAKMDAFETRAAAFTPLDREVRDWDCPAECPSDALAAIENQIAVLRDLARHTTNLLFREAVVNQALAELEARLGGLESVQRVRLHIENRAAGRPAVQLAIGGLLLRMHQVLRRPLFGAQQQEELSELQRQAMGWAPEETFVALYREALLRRRNDPDELPRACDIATFGDGETHRPLRTEMTTLLAWLDACDVATADSDQLLAYDEAMGKLNLLWHDKDTGWADALPTQVGRPLNELLAFADAEVWNCLEQNRSALSLRESAPSVEVRHVVDFAVRSDVPECDAERLRAHPLDVLWRISDEAVRTPGLTLARSFVTPGRVRIGASLSWGSRKNIAVDGEQRLTVVPAPTHPASLGWAEWLALLLAAMFASVTGMTTLYDSTFGSMGQYVTLFTWSAGTGTGANMFKRLGARMTVGGRPDVTLQARNADRACRKHYRSVRGAL